MYEFRSERQGSSNPYKGRETRGVTGEKGIRWPAVGGLRVRPWNRREAFRVWIFNTYVGLVLGLNIRINGHFLHAHTRIPRLVCHYRGTTVVLYMYIIYILCMYTFGRKSLLPSRLRSQKGFTAAAHATFVPQTLQSSPNLSLWLNA